MKNRINLFFDSLEEITHRLPLINKFLLEVACIVLTVYAFITLLESHK